MLYINPDECVDCAACEPACPVDAIYYDEEVPDDLNHYTQINSEFFVEIGSPGGASKLGIVEKGPASVMALPASSAASEA